jgi:hypothetical protein
MANKHTHTFTQLEYQMIHDKVATLEDMRLLGGEDESIDVSGAPLVLVMPLDDGPPRYVIRKEEGGFCLLNGDASTVVATGQLDEILAALP